MLSIQRELFWIAFKSTESFDDSAEVSALSLVYNK